MKDKKSICDTCVHAKKVLNEDIKGRYRLRCSFTRRFLEEPKSKCKDYEPETWQRFLDDSEEK